MNRVPSALTDPFLASSTVIKHLHFNLNQRAMKVTIQSPGFKADQKLINFTTEKLENLSHFKDTIIEGNVCLKLDKSDTGENKVCEIKLGIPGNDLFASKNAQTFEEAITKVTNALKRQLEEQKKEYKGGNI